jgi:hypothetical protein
VLTFVFPEAAAFFDFAERALVFLACVVAMFPVFKYYRKMMIYQEQLKKQTIIHAASCRRSLWIYIKESTAANLTDTWFSMPQCVKAPPILFTGSIAAFPWAAVLLVAVLGMRYFRSRFPVVAAPFAVEMMECQSRERYIGSNEQHNSQYGGYFCDGAKDRFFRKAAKNIPDNEHHARYEKYAQDDDEYESHDIMF